MPPQRRSPKTAKSTTSRTPTTGGGSRRTLWIALGGAAVVAIALIGGSLLLRGGDDNGSSTTPGGTGSTAVVDGIPQKDTLLGDPEAKVTLTQWEDFQCPACLAYQEDAFPGIVERWVRPGEVNVDFRGLTFIGEDSDKALRAALAAGIQGKLWQMQDLLFQNQGGENEGWVTDELIDELAATIGLDVEKLNADMGSAAVTRQIEDMASEGQKLGVSGTPTFFISIDGGTPYQVQPDAFSADGFAAIFDDALQQG